MPGGFALGARATIVRRSSGELWLHSPVPLSEADRAWFAEVGAPTTIVAPSLLHHLFLQEAVDAFPAARVFGPQGVEAKCGVAAEAMKEGIFGDELACFQIEGAPKMSEWVFLHQPTRTLILTDLAFNFQQAEGFRTRILLRINGALGRFGPSRLARTVFFEDKDALRKSVDRILEWDFDRVVLAHGQVLERGGPDALREGFAWLRT